jgi:DNA ligase-1
MLAQPFDEKRLAKWTPPFIVQPKLDGERCRAVIGKNGNVVLLSSEEHMILSVPHITEALRSHNLHDLELDGELYCHGMSFEEIHSRVGRTVNLHADSAQMEYHIFDLAEAGLPQRFRTDVLELQGQIFQSPLHIVKSLRCHSLDEILQAYDSFIELGYEGIIVRQADALYERKRSLWVMKFKGKKEDVYEIVGSAEEIDQHGLPKNRLGSLTCRGSDGTLFSVGTGFTADRRAELWQMRMSLPGQFVRVKYQHQTENHVPRFPVFAELFTIERS